MPAFRFRAQPALDLRRREYEAAQRALARADAERHHAQMHVEATECAIEQGRRDADAAVRANPTGADREWYRFWIVRLERDRSDALAPDAFLAISPWPRTRASAASLSPSSASQVSALGSPSMPDG